MFTGLIEAVGEIKSVSKSDKGLRLTIKIPDCLDKIQLGDSISTNGVCLTAVDISKDFFRADVMAETVRRSNLGELKLGSKVNLERALRLDSRLGGHIVTGHIDGTGILEGFEKEDNAIWISISAEPQLLKYIVEKGSIAIDGVSLTVAYVDREMFKVSIIPHTGQETTLLQKAVGDTVNLECDVIGKYVEKLLGLNSDISANKSNLDENFLKENGFL